MNQGRVMQPKQMPIQGKSATGGSSNMFQSMHVGAGTKFKDASWPRHGTETMAQMGRLLRGKLPK